MAFAPYSFAAAGDANDIVTSLREKKLKLQDAQDEAKAKALLGQMIQQALGRQSPQQIPTSPPPGQPSVPAQGPGTVMPPPQGGAVQRAPMPGAPPPQPQAGSAPPPQAPQPQPGAAPGPPGSALNPQGPQFSWSAVLDSLRQATGAKPEVVARAVMDIMPELDKEAARKDKMATAQAQIDQRNFALLQTLQWRYANSQSVTERAQIRAEAEELTQQMKGEAARDVAGIKARSAENVAGTQAGAKIYVAELGASTKEDIARDQNALKRELGSRALDIKADELQHTTSYRERVLDLREKGLDQQAAQAQAKLDMTKALAEMRDATAQRGQDMISKDKAAAIAARTQAAAEGREYKEETARGKAAVGVSSALEAIDRSNAMVDKLITDPGVEHEGTLMAHTPTVRDSTAQFETDLKTLKGQLLLQAIAQLKGQGGTTGLGRITNYEAQTIQSAMANLELAQNPEDIRSNLLNLKNTLSAAKLHVTQAYEQQFKPTMKPGKGAPPVGDPKAGGKTIIVPPNVPVGAKKQIDGKWYTVTKQGEATEQQ